MKKILILNMPSTFLYLPQPHHILYNGAGVIAGALKKHNNDVTYIDLNHILSNFRLKGLSEEQINEMYDINTVHKFFMPKEEYNTITKTDWLYSAIQFNKIPPTINTWMNVLIDHIIDIGGINQYDAIGYSVNTIGGDDYAPGISLSFTILFNYLLLHKSNKKIATYVGGHTTLLFTYQRPYGLADIINTYNPKYLPTRFIIGRAEYAFPKYINDRLDHDLLDKPINIDDYYYISPVDWIQSDKVLSLDAILDEHTKIMTPTLQDDSSISCSPFPKQILAEFPELKNTKISPIAHYKFSKGCIFSCAFCGARRHKWQHAQIPTIIDELKQLQDNGIQCVNFFNSNINFNKEWTKELCNAIIQNNIKIAWTDSANFRIYDNEMFDALASAGCIRLWWGIETASPKLQKIINKVVPLDQIESVLEMAAKVGIWSMGNIIINFPYETEDDFNQTFQFTKKLYTNQLIQGYKVNVFRIERIHLYAKKPENFNIKLREQTMVKSELDNIPAIPFDEINGRTYEQIIEDGKTRYDIFNNDPALISNHTISDNDVLLFRLHNVFGRDIKKIRNIIENLDKNFPDYLPPMMADLRRDTQLIYQNNKNI